mgnify:CR=1 FL=1
MPGPSPLVGYNTNVRHKGKLYHIQTEDSGVNHPHVITHLFADGGRIIASRKTGYSEHLGAKDLQSIVKKLMQEQHKAMFIELRDCVYDDDPHQPQSVPLVTQSVAAPAPASSLAERIDQAEQLAAASQPSAAGTEPARAAFAPPEVRAVAAAPRVATNATAAAGSPRTAVPMPAPRFVGTPPPMAVPTRNALDADELDRAAEARLLGSAIGRARGDSARRGVGRYQQTVPAKPARPTRPPTPRSIFGGDALRGKSLDEVILSYLADDASDTER